MISEKIPSEGRVAPLVTPIKPYDRTKFIHASYPQQMQALAKCSVFLLHIIYASIVYVTINLWNIIIFLSCN